MKSKVLLSGLLLLIILLVVTHAGFAQCAICSKTAEQLGDKSASGLNNGILYLMLTPFGIAGFIGYKWWKSYQEEDND